MTDMVKIKVEEMGKGSEFFNMMSDFWSLNKKYLNGDKEHRVTDEFCEAMVADVQKFYEKYRTSYAKDLALALVNCIDRKHHEALNNLQSASVA